MIDLKEESTADLIKRDHSYIQDIDKVSGITGAMLIKASSKIREELDERMIAELHHTWDYIAVDFLRMYEDSECPAEDIHHCIWDFVHIYAQDKVVVEHFQDFDKIVRIDVAKRAFPHQNYCI